jgi:hypothetical protein
MEENNTPRASADLHTSEGLYMTNTILVARLYNLKQKLDRIPRWLQSGLQDDEGEDGLWASIDATVGAEARLVAEEAGDLRNTLEQSTQNKADVEDAWNKYSKLYTKSQQIFGEALELIGGLYIRNKDLDEGIYGVADELVSNCAITSIGQSQNVFITIPSHQETVDRALARIIRLRFPEWTIWTLPFTAHEFGHVVMTDSPKLQSHVYGHTDGWTTYQIQEILADTFATYTMGPAYACAAILLQFDPPLAPVADSSPDPVADPHRLSDVIRAYTILAMLRKMDREAPKGPVDTPPYKNITTSLEKQWQGVLGHVRSSSGHNLEFQKYEKPLDKLVEAIWKRYRVALRPSAQYPVEGKTGDGWNLAKNWGQDWLKQLNDDKPLSMPDVTSTDKLRDVVNAAWICRVYSSPRNADKIAGVALQLCNRITGKRKGNQGPSVQP